MLNLRPSGVFWVLADGVSSRNWPIKMVPFRIGGLDRLRAGGCMLFLWERILRLRTYEKSDFLLFLKLG